MKASKSPLQKMLCTGYMHRALYVHRAFSLCAAHLVRRIGLRGPNDKWLAVLDLSWEIMNFGAWTRNLGKVWVPKRSKNMQNMTSLPLFWHTGSSLGRMHFWRGKWTPNWKIPLALEIRQERLSNKTTWAQFGLRQVPQNQQQSSATHTEISAAHRGFWPNFSPSNSEIWPVWLVFLLDVIFYLSWCNWVNMM